MQPTSRTTRQCKIQLENFIPLLLIYFWRTILHLRCWLVLFKLRCQMLEIEASKLYEISGLTKTANGLPRGVTPVNTRKRNLNQNKTIFTNTTLSYAFLQFMSQIHDVACSTSCMILHGLLMESLLNIPMFCDISIQWISVSLVL